MKVNGENADKLYDAFLTMDTKTYANAKADSIKYGIKTAGLTISCSANAKYSLPFVVHTLDVTGKIMKTEGVYVQFSRCVEETGFNPIPSCLLILMNSGIRLRRKQPGSL